MGWQPAILESERLAAEPGKLATSNPGFQGNYYESLYHVTCECEEYSGARVRGVIREILPRAGTEVFLIHRARWSWRELKAIRNFFLDIVSIRDAALGKQRCRASSLQEIAERHWY